MGVAWNRHGWPSAPMPSSETTRFASIACLAAAAEDASRSGERLADGCALGCVTARPVDETSDTNPVPNGLIFCMLTLRSSRLISTPPMPTALPSTTIGTLNEEMRTSLPAIG